MRKLNLMLALTIGLSAYAGAKIEWDHHRHDFGAFSEDAGPVTAHFVYYNTGEVPLVITGARANCGCTTPQVTAKVLEPGDSATLSVTYDPGGRPGRFEKKVYVDTNGEPAKSTLTICGVAVGSPTTIGGKYPVEAGCMRLAHPAALLGVINRGVVKSVLESGYNACTDTIRPFVSNVPDWLKASVYPTAVPPGEQFSLSFIVNSSKIPEWDLVTDTVTVMPFANSGERIRMPVVVTVSEDFSKLSDKERMNSPIVRFEHERLEPVFFSPGNAKTVDIKIFNDGNSPLKIRRIYTRTPGVKFETKKDEIIKPGKSKTIKATLPEDCLKGSKASAVLVTIITNDPVSPKKIITIPVATE